MNPKLALLFSRRSIRAYTAQPVDDATVTDLLQAAMAAPSACCTDPWEFIVVRDAHARKAIAAALPNGGMLATAPIGILICGNLHRAHGGELSYMLQDCAAAMENLLLAATALGLGACWLGVHPRAERIARLKEMFALPEHIVPFAAVALGWPAQEAPARTRFRESCVHWEKW